MTATAAAPRAIVLFAHGARDPEWALPFERIRAALADRLGNRCRVALAFLEFMQPPLADAVGGLAADGIAEVLLVPLFMAQGGHLKHDLPIRIAELRVRHPTLALRVAPAVGDVDEILAAIVEWILRELDAFP
jgi:sirohydrochlorin cobaltochelatase